MLQGSLVAIVTPMKDNGELDFAGLESLIDWHVESGTAGIVIVGTTGESPTVSMEEHKALIERTVRYTNKRVAVIAGTGANSTLEAIELTRFAEEVGADYSLSVVPYYNKPTQQGLYAHFKAISEAVSIPIILYNVPGRTVADMSNDTVVKLAQLKNIVGIKDATADLYRASDLFSRVPKEFACYTGDDGTAAAFMLMGGQGVISVTANVAPRAMADLCQAALQGNVSRTREINDKLLALHRDLFIEANPIPVKWALAEMKKMGPGIRLPLTQLSEQHHETIRAALKRASLI